MEIKHTVINGAILVIACMVLLLPPFSATAQPEQPKQPEIEQEGPPDSELDPDIKIEPTDPSPDLVIPLPEVREGEEEGNPTGVPVVLPTESEGGSSPSLDFLTPGDPDIYSDLELEESEDSTESSDTGVLGFGEERFDSGVLRNESLPGGFQIPLAREGFRFGVGVQGSYDSNVYLAERGESDDFNMTISPTFEYRSAPPGVPGLVTAIYSPFVRLYLEEDDLSTIDHSASASVSYTGARGSYSVAGNFGRFSRADRFVGGVVETQSFSGSLHAEYRVASRTTLRVDWSEIYSTDSDRGQSTQVQGNSDNRTSVGQAALYWQATSKTSIGPSIRYSRSSSATNGDRDSWAFLVVADHSRGESLSLSGSIGVETVESDQIGEESGLDFTGNFGLTYRPSDRVAVTADVRYEAIPQGNVQATRSGGGSQNLTGRVEVTYTPNAEWIFGFGAIVDSFPVADLTNYSVGDQTYRAWVTRNLTNGSLTFEGSLSMSDFERVGAVNAPRTDDESHSLALRYQRNIQVQGQAARANASLQWSQNSGDRDWERLQATLGVDVSF